MPPLTWRDTVQPDFGTTLSGIKVAGDSMNRGLGGIGDALGKFNEFAQGQNAAALMANAVKYTNPADLQKAFADGSIMSGVNPGYLTADALKSTQGQVGALLHDAANTETNAFNVKADPSRLNVLHDNDKVLAGTQAARIASPALANDATRAQIGFTGAQTTGLNIANDQATHMNPLLVDQQGEVNRGRTLGNDASALGLTQAQRSDADTLAARPLINQLSAAQDADGVNRVLASPEAVALTPGARAQLIAASQALPGMGGIGSGGGTGGGSNGGGGANAARAIAGAVANPGGLSTSVYDPTSPISSARTEKGSIPVEHRASLLRDAVAGTPIPPALLNAQITQESGWNPTRVGKAGDRGLMQILDSTAKDPGFGLAGVANPNDLNDPVANLKFGAQYLYQRGKAAGLTDADWTNPAKVAQALKAYNGGGDPDYDKHVLRYMPGGAEGAGPGSGPSNASDAISNQLQAIKAREERVAIQAASTIRSMSTGDAQKRAQASEASIYSPTVVNDTDKAGNVIGQHMLQAAVNDTTTPIGDVAAQMSASGSYKGLAVERLANMIKQVQQDAGGISPMAAKVIIEAHPENAGALARYAPYLLGGYNSVPDEAAIHKAALAVRDGTLEQTATNSSTSAVIQQKITAAAAEQQTAARALAAALRDPNKADQVKGYQAKLDAAEKIFEAVQKPAWNQDSLHPVLRDANGNVMPRHYSTPASDSFDTPASASASGVATGPGASSSSSAASTIAPSIPGRDSSDPDVQAARSKVQAALDRLTVARERNDPKVKGYAQAYNRTTSALQAAIGSTSQNIPSSIQGRD